MNSNARCIKRTFRRAATGAVLGVFLSLSPLWGAQGGGERPAAYMLLGMGGRETALGGAADALRGDATAAYYNPAGLTGVRTFQVRTQYAFLTQGRTLGALTVGNRLEKSPLSYALGWVYFSHGSDLEARQGPSLNPDSTFGDTEMTFLMGVGYRFSPRWHMGASFKIHRQAMYTVSAWGGGFDVGVLYRLTKVTSFGVVVKDLYTKLSPSNGPSATVPPGLHAAFSRNLGPKALLALQADYSADYGLRPRGGLEWLPLSGVAVRLGWGGGTFRGGFGINARGSKRLTEEIEYTFQQDRVTGGGLLHQVSVGLRFL